MTAYRQGPTEQRRELLARRDAILGKPLRRCPDECRVELEALRRRLETAEDDPLDHVEEGLRLYGMALEAGRAVGEQRGFHRRRLVAAVSVVVGSLLAFFVGRVGYQFVSHEALMNPCTNQDATGQHHEVIRHDGMLGIDFRCEALSDADCEQPCRTRGDCAAVEGRCVPLTDAHCQQSEICGYHGECELRGGSCLAGSEQDCRDSEGCRLDGVCSHDGRRCVPRSDGDCKASVRCRQEGFCRLGFSGCEHERGPAVDECVRMSHCLQAGLCSRDEMPEGCILRGPPVEASSVTVSSLTASSR